ncbi:hypothetical protein DUNSADRAFT_14055 [Dunaliella salina]|uniref:RNase III domain-containing protein n=1 Tax=Dunaliella salina TaxID=3046 RepID=A0ABQ7G848_DUNSA|nr:hypothetical protein DUNSADRAFT_14055 [Dunaliella salina]|eukprot:KAF5830788.1 hypothetical protein DUNSADRAFT_14055 [Dunaliella salina]
MHTAFPKFPQQPHCFVEARELVLTGRPQHTRHMVNSRPHQRDQRQQHPESTSRSFHQEVAASTYTAASLPPPPDLQGKNPRALLNTTALAFLGDSVWEVLLRAHVMGAYPAIQAGASSPLHLQKQDAAKARGSNLASSTPTTSKQSKPSSARTQRMSGRDLTVAARAKANATQQASYFDYLWAASSAHVKALAGEAATSGKPGSSQSNSRSSSSSSSSSGKSSRGGAGFGSSSSSSRSGTGLGSSGGSGSSSSRSGAGFGSSGGSGSGSSSSSSKGFGVPKPKASTSNYQSTESKLDQGVRHSTEFANQQSSKISDSSFSPGVSPVDHNLVDASNRESSTEISAFDVDNPASPPSWPGRSSCSSSGSSVGQAHGCVDGKSDIPRSISEENSDPTLQRVALEGRLQATLLTEEEMDVLRWGRNSNAVSPPKNVDSRVYKKATALEVLVGYLYLTDTERCVSLVHHLLSLPSPGSTIQLGKMS